MNLLNNIMQHLFGFIIDKQEGSENMEQIKSTFVTQSSRPKKVAVTIQKECIKRGWVTQKEIKDVYVLQLR